MTLQNYILYGIKESSKHLICDGKLRELVDTAEYILLKAKDYTFCEIHDENGIVWAATTNMLNENMFVVYPVPAVINQLMISVEEQYVEN